MGYLFTLGDFGVKQNAVGEQGVAFIPLLPEVMNKFKKGCLFYEEIQKNSVVSAVNYVSAFGSGGNSRRCRRSGDFGKSYY